MKSLLLIGDSDVLISTINKDSHHEKVKLYYKKLSEINATVYFPAAIVAEAITTCQIKLKNARQAKMLVTQLTSELIDTIPTDDEILRLAADLFKPFGSKRNTFFDAIVAASAKKYSADAIFSFDGWYQKQGFTGVYDLLKI